VKEVGTASTAAPGAFWTVGAISVAHEVPGALATIMAPTLFIKELGLDVRYLGLFALPVLVNAVKWLWAPLVDNTGSQRFGRRLSWLLPAAAVVAALYGAVGLVIPAENTLLLVIGLFCLVAVAFSAYEIAGDAYVVENLGLRDTGPGAGAVWFGKELGQIIGLAGLLTIADQFGWRAAFFSAAGLFLVLNAAVALRREAPVRALEHRERASVRRFIKEGVNRRILLLVFAVAFALQMPSAVIGPFLSSKGLTLSEIGATIGIAASLGAGLSLATASFAIRVMGAKRLAIWLIPIGLMAAPAFLWLAQAQGPTVPLVIAAIFWGSLCTAPLRMVFYAARLGWTSTAQAGTDFTLQQSVWFLGHAAAMAAGGVLAAQIGWFWFFVVNAFLTMLAMAIFVASYDGIDRAARALAAPSSP
jgi:MFS transporter, PAT family, beta-lactamase induction signal transducer AmpG